MPNLAFQKSLRSKDKDKFVASLREGGMVEDKSYWEETASNIIPSGKKLLKETADMIMNPIDTAKSLYQLGSGVVQLAIPGEQGNEGIARAAGQYFADRYGSLEKAKESFKNDPVGVATEALGVAAGGAGLGKLAVKGAGKVSKVLPEIDTTAMASFPGIKFKDKNLKTAPTKTVDEMAELTASVKVTDDVISNQIKEFNKGKTLKSNKWTEPIWYHGSGQRNLKHFEGDPSVRYESHQGAPFGTFITPNIIDASTYGPYLYTVRIKKDLKIWTMGRRNEPLPKKGVIEKIEPDRPHMLYKPITLGKTDNKITSSMLKAYEKHLTNYYGGPDMMIPRLLDDFKKSGRIKYELPASQMTDILRKGGYQAVNDGQGHVIMLNPKKDIKIEGVADNSNVAVNVGTHLQHERKLVEAERLAPLDQAMYSTRRGFTDYTVEPPVEYKKLDLNVKGLPIIDEAKEAHKNSLISVLNQGDLTRKETAGVIEKLRSLGVPNLAKGGIPTAATGIGLEEIVVKGTKKDGGGGRVSFGERGDSNIFGREYVGKEGGGSGYYDYSKEVPEGTPLTEPGSLIPAEEYTGEEEQGVLYSVDKLEDFHEEIGVNKKLLSKVLDVIASDYNLNPDALALIASTETDLHMDKISSAGARGIGQIKEIMLDDINNRADSMFDGSTFTMDDLGKDLLTDVDLMARGLKVSQHYAKYLGKNPNDFYIVSQIYKQGMDNIRNNNYDTTYDDRLTKRGNAIGVDYKDINLSNVPELQEGGTPWGGATGTIYEEPSGPKPLQQQMINAFSEGGISDDKPSLKKKASFAPFLDTGKKALEFAGAFTGPIGAASFLGRQIASGEGYSGEPLSGNNTAGMNVTSGNVESGRGTRSATTATPDTIVRQPETEQDYEERVSVYDNSIKEKQELEQYFKDNFSNPNAGKEFEYEGTKYIEPSVEIKSLSELNELNQDLINKKLIKLEYKTQNGPVKSFVSIKDLHLMLKGDDPVDSYIAGLAFDGLGQGKSTVVDSKNKNSITVKFTSTVEESI